MFLGVLFAYLAGNFYIFFRGWQALARFSWAGSTACRILFPLFFWGAALSLFAALFFRGDSLPQWLSGGLYNVGSVWLVFVLYMVLALFFVDFLRMVFFRTGKVYVFFARFGTLAAFCFTSALLLYGFINYKNPRIEEVEVDFSHGEASGKTVKIVAVSDVHLGHATGKRSLQRYVKLINEQHPDIILIGGDLIDNDVVPLRLHRMWEELGQLDAPMGIFMVPGNHEYIAGIEAVEDFLRDTPVVLLRDSSVVLPCGVEIVGRDDRSNRSRKGVAELLSECAGLPVILVDHQPYEVALKDSLGVDFQFSGHTHRGQVWPMSLFVDRMYEQSYGYRKWSNSHVVVSCGLSLWGPPFRIGTSSDLWVIKMHI